jgi:hypothetical protein
MGLSLAKLVRSAFSFRKFEITVPPDVSVYWLLLKMVVVQLTGSSLIAEDVAVPDIAKN